jgi:hypothetical protein
MSRLLALSVVSGLLALASGCAMCCAPFDYDYPSTTGRWVRNNPTSGRVGSVFDEAGAPVDVASTAATPAPASTPAQPAAPAAPVPRSVIPRNMGQNYLPQAQ